MNFNKVILGGRLTRDPELVELGGGVKLAKFGIAVNHKRKDKEEVMFVDCAAFNKTGELILEHFDKGKPILLEGRLRLEQWETKEGKKASRHSVVVDSFSFVGSAEKQERKPANPVDDAPPIDPDNIPF